ncbi:cupin domain-containing protein [Rhodoferax aquaticus]|uniref:Cupin domain-containing protein n=1 Tax=Rhodoferax aquaticus TaxID=2527691 RepID=A0A515EMW1_9BURK|nr:cupin domain-containing protein [Rhodoferax aquaticus]QDL53964.1 cupin domain-containing protein [Rhodoferax aquaticus]
MNQPPEHPLSTTPSHAAHNAAPYRSINFAEKFGLFQDQWRQKVLAQMNDYQFKLARLQGDFIWHEHAETDETFVVLEGQLRIDFQDGHVLVSAGEMYVVPKGVMHKPFAEQEVKLLLIEPCGTVNTGNAGGSRTVSSDEWI